MAAKLIIRRATPPWVRKLPARMKNGTAMISNFSMPVKSFSATDSIGTLVIVKMKIEHREAERDRDRHAGQHQRHQQREDDAARSPSDRRCRSRRQAMISDSSVRAVAACAGVRDHARGSGTALIAASAPAGADAGRATAHHSSTPSTCATSWCGSSPVREKVHATCRKRKHIR